MKRMLINATQPEERRLAIVDGQKLLDFETELEGREQRKGNIYKAVITRVEPSLEACFVDYGEDRHGFLPFKEISRNYFREGVDNKNPRIQDAVKEGDNLLIQVEKEERGNKGAALTTFVSLAGRYLVLMPNNPRGGGVSRRIEGEQREELKENLDQLEYPKGMSLIARTAGIGRSAAELQWDLNYMLKLWEAIDGASKAGKGAFLIYQESSLVIRAIRDYFTADIGEILIDTDDIFEQAQQFMNHVMPETASRVKRYRDDAPLFSRFQIEHQIESAYAREVKLPSGGVVVIDHENVESPTWTGRKHFHCFPNSNAGAVPRASSVFCAAVTIDRFPQLHKIYRFAMKMGHPEGSGPAFVFRCAVPRQHDGGNGHARPL